MPSPKTNAADEWLSNEQWAAALQLFAELVDGANPTRVIARQRDDGVRNALENLWRQHLLAEKARFLEDQITLVNDRSGSGGPSVFQPGQILAGRFAILRLLGRGGMGEVYLADDQRLSETVALKTVKREFAKEKDKRDRFLSEIQNSRRVTHPNVCRIFDLFEHDGVPFFSMEYVAGPSLNEVLAAGPLNPERAQSIALQMAEGLWAAHRNSILHCDLKPANILLTGSGKNERAVITDFGLARALGRPDPHGHSQTIAGTPPYIAPELLVGRPPTVRSDIYAFGKVLKGMLPDNKLALECSDSDPDKRPQSMEQVLRELRGSPSRRSWLVAALVGAAGVGLYVYDYSRPRIPLGSRQRVVVNGFKPESGDVPKIVRNLVIMALRQCPLLSVVGDRPYASSGRASLFTAGSALPLPDLLSSLRESKANLAIDGDVENHGRGLRLVLNVYEPVTKTPRYTTTVEVPSRKQLVQLAELAATDLRVSGFGESGMHSSYMPLEQITTSSTEALDYYFQAVFAYERSNAVSPLVLLEQALKLDPEFVLAHHYRAIVLASYGLTQAAEVSAEKAFSRRMRVAERERNWIDAVYYILTGSWEESATALQKNTTLFPDEAVFERHFAFTLTRLGRYDEAIPHNRRAVELDPFSDNNRSELLVNLAEANRIEECFAELENLDAGGQKPSLVHRTLTLAYLQTGDYGKSVSECQLLAQGAKERESWARLLNLAPLVMLGRFTEAIQSIEGDLAADSVHPELEREEIRMYMRHNALGQLRRLIGEPSLAAQEAEFLTHLPPVGANLIPLREGCALGADLNDSAIIQQGLERLVEIARRWPSSHSQSAVWLTEAMLKQLKSDAGATELFSKAKGTWPDPINLFYTARWEGNIGLLDAQLATLLELERLRGKVYKHHFAGFVVLGWLEQARCLQKLSRFEDSSRTYEKVLKHWGTSQAAHTDLIRQTRKELDAVRIRKEARS
ncbi:MAG: protein kinase [Acidobacteriaceae bacterium]|nr:protein kinase [Acidobacteriaceae bacterium]